MTTTIKSQGTDSVIVPKKKKSVLELAMEIPKGKYAGITKMLEPHEIPKTSYDRKTAYSLHR